MNPINRTVVMGGVLAVILLAGIAPVAARDKSGLHVPPGHQPRAGECRVWFPDRPPGHQPRPGNCRALSGQVPRGAWLVGHDRSWSYDELREHRYGRGRSGYFGRRSASRREIRKDLHEVREARADVRKHQEQLRLEQKELKKDRAELREDIRNGAGRREIRRDRREIREDLERITDHKQAMRQSHERLEAAREELRDNWRRR